MAKTIMMQGTSSHVGKSILTTALCRIFRQDGLAVAPFKAQNMALNSYVTIDGEEMGRAQVAQAEAAGLAPLVKMNPVLLKPTGNSCSQVILKGRPVGNMSAQEYHREYSLKAFSVIQECMAEMLEEFEAVVIEGAGSPAEVNLKATDVVNMRIAKLVQAPVLLIADIDRGGALASVVGTLELLDQDERDLVKGIVINKFRGDIELLRPALNFLNKRQANRLSGSFRIWRISALMTKTRFPLKRKKAGRRQNSKSSFCVRPRFQTLPTLIHWQRSRTSICAMSKWAKRSVRRT